MVQRYGKEVKTVDIYQENIDKIRAEGKEPKETINDTLAATYAIRALAFPTFIVNPTITVIDKKKSIIVTDTRTGSSATVSASRNNKLYCNQHKSENCDHTAVIWAGHTGLAVKLLQD